MNYVPIKFILARDFRNLQEVKIDFTESPIVSLVGENESGKSSVIKAVTTVGANLDPNRQKEYIRTGTQGFLVGICFDDDDHTIVVRQKGNGLNCYFVQKLGKVVWSVTKMDDSSVPPEVQKYVGFVLEPETKELLNVRTYEDLMIFIHTANSTNYKIMYNALKVESLMKAKRLGQLEMNTYKSEINKAEQSIATLTDQLRKIKLVDLDPLIAIQSKLRGERDALKDIESTASLKDKLLKLESESSLLDHSKDLVNIDEMEAYLLNSVSSNVEKLKSLNKELVNLDEIDSLESIDTDTVEKMNNILSMLRKLNELSTNIYADIDKAETIDLIIVDRLQRTKNEVGKLNEVDNKLNLYGSVPDELNISDLKMFDDIFSKMKSIEQYDSQIAELNTEITKIEDYLKQSGVMVTTCRNCGSTVIYGEV